jgi:hypothetical protein
MERLRPREIVVPLLVGLAVAFIQTIFSGPDLVRIIVYFFVGLVLTALFVLLFRYARGRPSRTSINDLGQAARLGAESPKARESPSNPKTERTRAWGC